MSSSAWSSSPRVYRPCSHMRNHLLRADRHKRLRPSAPMSSELRHPPDGDEQPVRAASPSCVAANLISASGETLRKTTSGCARLQVAGSYGPRRLPRAVELAALKPQCVDDFGHAADA